MPGNLSKAQPSYAALFISDLHLHPSHPKTAQAFFDFLKRQAVHAKQLYILGDLFEYWAGDDDIASDFNRTIIAAIREASDAGIEIFWISGNRDFLAGEGFARATGTARLSEPHVAVIAGQRVTLTHGDAQCIEDQAYVEFRNKVRNPDWQNQFLAMPLEKRKSIIEGLRNDSREEQRAKKDSVMDVTPSAVTELFEKTDASIIIHGHTHRPARHEHLVGNRHCYRYVLPEWDYDSETIRGGWIAIRMDGRIAQFDANGYESPSA